MGMLASTSALEEVASDSRLDILGNARTAFVELLKRPVFADEHVQTLHTQRIKRIHDSPTHTLLYVVFFNYARLLEKLHRNVTEQCAGRGAGFGARVLKGAATDEKILNEILVWFQKVIIFLLSIILYESNY